MVIGEGRDPIWVLGGSYHPPKPVLGGQNGDLLDMIGQTGAGAPLTGAALTVALDVVQAWAVLITLGFTLILFFFLAFCVCAKKDDGYDDFEITHDITTVKICDGGENGVSLLPRLNGSMQSTDETSEASSRCTLKRELPAIPIGASTDHKGSDCRVERTASQHSSELYAAVGDPGNVKLIGGVQVLPSRAPGGRPAVVKDVTPSTDSEQGICGRDDIDGNQTGIHHPYAKVKKDHQYAQVKLPKNDHPYAKVGSNDSEDPETDTDNYEDPKNVMPTNKRYSSEAMYEPAPTIMEARSEMLQGSSGLTLSNLSAGRSPHDKTSPLSGQLSQPSSISPQPGSNASGNRSPLTPRQMPPTSSPVEIPAAMAISGQTPANEELPYMTPPLLHGGVDVQNQPQNFSGDSQDSRGYTSISVREPLAALKAQTASSGAAATNRQSGAHLSLNPLEGEGYYMTVSDDSADEMYACIYEGSRGTGSETYAQIEPRSGSSPTQRTGLVTSPLAQTSTSPALRREEDQAPPPAPPSVDSLKHVVHSRQASSSSAGSTVMGSPVAEKRGTKSPLPPLPQGDANLYSVAGGNTVSPSSPKAPISPPPPLQSPERQGQKPLEEMYAKVNKKQRSGHSRGNSAGAESDTGSISSSRRGSTDIGQRRISTPPTSPHQSIDMSATKSPKTVEASKTGHSRAKSYEMSNTSWSISHSKSPSVGNYETINQTGDNFYSGGSTYPQYETVKNNEPAYASVNQGSNYPGYETVEVGRGFGTESEPGYETLKHQESEPGYETVPNQRTVEEPGYETVSHRNANSSDNEGGYETVKEVMKTSDPGYESVKGESSTVYSDPGYEPLQGSLSKDVAMSEHDPNYEQLKFSHSSGETENDPKYEIVQKKTQENAYELVSDYKTQEIPTYEQISKPTVTSPVKDIPLYSTIQRKDSEKTSPIEKDTPVIVSEILKSETDKKEESIESESEPTTTKFIPKNIVLPSNLIDLPAIGSPIIQPPTPNESSSESSVVANKNQGKMSQNTSEESKSTSSNDSPVKEIKEDVSKPLSEPEIVPDAKTFSLDLTSEPVKTNKEDNSPSRSPTMVERLSQQGSPISRNSTKETYPLVRGNAQHESPPIDQDRKAFSPMQSSTTTVDMMLKKSISTESESENSNTRSPSESPVSEISEKKSFATEEQENFTKESSENAIKETSETSESLVKLDDNPPKEPVDLLSLVPNMQDPILPDPVDLPPASIDDLPPVSMADLPPVSMADLPPVSMADLPPVSMADLPPVSVADLPPVSMADLPPISIADLPPVSVADLPPVSVADIPPVSESSSNINSCLINNIGNDDPLPPPPPPLPSAEDFEASSPPPPPPPMCGLIDHSSQLDSLEDKEPPPPIIEDGMDIQLPPPISMETPPPPPLLDFSSPEHSMCRQTSPVSTTANGNMTVTVNPMAQIDELVNINSSISNGMGNSSNIPLRVSTSESQNSNGANSSQGTDSSESVVTVEATSPPLPPPPPPIPSNEHVLEHSGSSSSSTSMSSSDSKHIENSGEGITPV